MHLSKDFKAKTSVVVGVLAKDDWHKEDGFLYWRG